MLHAYKGMRRAIFSSPHLLLNYPDRLRSIASSYLPYDTGIEIECMTKKPYNEANFKSIPNIKDINNDREEVRFRIPTGITGMICLYDICTQLKRNNELNPLSGIHYHIDMTDVYKYKDSYKTEEFRKRFSKWILPSLDSWNYKGTFNNRVVGTDKNCWVYPRTGMKTIEIRIGEMSFDYELIVKRILHCQSLIKRLKKEIIANFA